MEKNIEKNIAIPCKLLIIPQQREHLECTLQAFAEACNYVWQYGKENGVSQQRKLHEACYQNIRDRFGLPANLTIRALARVATLLYYDKASLYPFVPNRISFDSRTFMLKDKEWSIGLTLLHGREKFHLDIGNFQKKKLLGRTITSATLVKKYKSYYLDIQV